MKTLRLLPFLLLVASPASAQLLHPAADRLADYHAWFDPLDPSAGLVAPDLQTPGNLQIDNTSRDWSSWLPNLPPNNLTSPITGITNGLYCEVVFLGQTGAGWGRFGYRMNDVDHLLSQTAASRHFGNYALPLPTDLDVVDFFVESADGNGGWIRYYAFEQNLNPPLPTPAESYWGSLTPLTSARGDMGGLAGDAGIPFTVLAFESGIANDNSDPALFVFAVRAGHFEPTHAVPEPATYGLAATAALLALITRRRSCERRHTGVRSIP